MRTFFSTAVLCAALACPILVIAQTTSETVFASAYAQASDARDTFLAGNLAQSVALALPLAEAGNPVAQNLLGAAYTDSSFDGFDYDAGIMWLNAAMDQGFDKAAHNLGLTYLEDLPEQPANETAAAAAFGQGATLGYLPSYAELIYLRLFGADDVRNPPMAQALISEALALDPENGLILFQAAEAAYTGTGEPEDLVKALALYQQSAATDHANANFAAGYMLTYGEGAAMDDAAADAYFERAIALGHVEAHGYLARSLLYGYGGPVDAAKARAVAEAGAALQDGLSLAMLGGIYEAGSGVDTDYAKARALYTQSYEAGRVDALNLLADLAYYGLGEPEDKERYFALVSQAVAEGESYTAPYNVGYAQLYGEGTPQDIPAAIANLDIAWEAGNENALAEMVTLFGHPDFASSAQNPMVAYAYCILARDRLDIDSDPDFYDTATFTCTMLDDRLTDIQKDNAALVAEGL